MSSTPPSPSVNAHADAAENLSEDLEAGIIQDETEEVNMPPRDQLPNPRSHRHLTARPTKPQEAA